MSPSLYQTEQMAHVDPRAVVESMAGVVFIERHVAGVSAHATSCGRPYRGNGTTEREACWKLLANIASRQSSVESCL